MELTRAVEACIQRYRLLEPGMRVGVACSGGPDSVCLLAVLRDLASTWRVELVVLHVNHGLRGAESDEDQRFVEALGTQWGLPVHVVSGPVENAGNLEQEARRVRLREFARWRAELQLDRIATGHTRSDQAETVLFRMLRGSVGGLRGIRWQTEEGLVRPLLDITREQVLGFLQSRELSWREDSSNAETRFARNRIRHELLPALRRDWNPNLDAALANLATVTAGEEEYFRSLVPDLLPARRFRDGWVVQSAALAGLPVALGRRVVRHQAERVKGDLRRWEFAHVEAVLDLARSGEGHGRVEAPGVTVFRSFDELLFLAAARSESESAARFFCRAVEVPASYLMPDGETRISFAYKEIPSLARRSDVDVEGRWIDADLVQGALYLRTWTPGDSLQQSAKSEKVKIKLLFQEGRVPLWERKFWPVLALGAGDEAEVVWTRKFGVARRFQAGPESRRVLEVWVGSVEE